MAESIDDKRIFDGAFRYDRNDPQFAGLLGRVAALALPADRPLFIVISGPGGSGKTTIAYSLSDYLTEIPRVSVPVMNADDFYPDVEGSQSRITADWDTYNRAAMRGLMAHLRRGRTVRYPSLNWVENVPGAEVVIRPYKYVIAEGVGLLHPDTRGVFDLTVWADPGSDATAMERGIARMGEAYRRMWEEVWTPSDIAFREKHHPSDHADMVFDTSGK